MPEKMQVVGHLSALSWGLDAINDIYLRNGDIAMVWKKVLMLVGVSVVMLAVAGYIEKRRLN
jgi:ABC-2 type transport system permease protein